MAATFMSMDDAVEPPEPLAPAQRQELENAVRKASDEGQIRQV
jgi:hypothetical protein